MFVIFGTKSTQKIVAQEGKIRCGRCNNISNWVVIKVTNWFSLFFIPIIPLSVRYYEQCPICRGLTQITKEEAATYILKGETQDV